MVHWIFRRLYITLFSLAHIRLHSHSFLSWNDLLYLYTTRKHKKTAILKVFWKRCKYQWVPYGSLPPVNMFLTRAQLPVGAYAGAEFDSQLCHSHDHKKVDNALSWNRLLWWVPRHASGRILAIIDTSAFLSFISPGPLSMQESLWFQ